MASNSSNESDGVKKNQTQKGFKSKNHKNNSNGKTSMDNRNGKGSSGTYDKTQFQDKSSGSSCSSDEDRGWKFRPPPRGFTADSSYVLCQNFIDNSVCSFGSNCVEAHGERELEEWRERFEIRKNKVEKSLKTGYGKSYTEDLLDRLQKSTNPEKIMKERLEVVEVTCSNELNLTVSSKTCKREWIFVLKTSKMLNAVALLQDEYRSHFTIKHVYPMIPGKQTLTQFDACKATNNNQEWLANTDSNKALLEAETNHSQDTLVSHRVKIGFTTEIYGTFRQAVCFEFEGVEAILVNHFCIDVVPLEEYDKIQEIRNDILTVTRNRWNSSNANLVPYKAVQVYSVHNATAAQDTEKENELLQRYPCPQANTFVLSQITISGKLSECNYQQWMHTLLYIEEMARFDLIAKFNLTTILKITNNFILAPNGMATSTAKYSHSGELFGVLELSQNISEETPPGYLILNNCNSLYLSSADQKSDDKPHVYEALIEDKSKNIIYLKLSADTVKELGLKHEEEMKVEIQFQPNRLTYCEWHMAVDKITDYKIIFPDTLIGPDIPWNPKRQWDVTLDQKLNSKQREAVLTITSPLNIKLPPVLLIGPFGTGKTFTLAQIIKQLLSQRESRILICTHSNSAADLYIREYLHPWVESGIPDAKPLRVYYHKRWVATVNSTVQKYCLIELKGNTRVFKKPTVEDLQKHKIVVVTLSTSMELASLNLKKGFFTHILLDEAAQALESEAITPLALADSNTRIVLAGDHMQMSPEIFSNFARERKLHVSLLERLYDHYPPNFPTKILLCENYRAHDAIIKFTSELFYDQKLIASGKQPRHEKFYPLTFFTTRGEDIQDKNSTAFYNNAEVYEIVERVCELRRKWPASWGKFNDVSIGIMTPYADQVFRIRSELRKKRMAGISVERVLNVQGKQFRAVFLSTVRTRKTCSNKTEDIDYGFLSNSKLLNTAITRAQSLVSVVGDPVALCSVGRCRKVWERFIETCHHNKSLFGITWQSLKSQLDGVELRKIFVLNPLAPEFIPRIQTESYLRNQIMRNSRSYNSMMLPHGSNITAAPVNPPLSFHHSQHTNIPHQSSFHPHMPPAQNVAPPISAFPSVTPTQQQFINSNHVINQQVRPYGSPSYHHLGPIHPPLNQNVQQFSGSYSNGPVPFSNPVQSFNQPNPVPLSQTHQPIMSNFHMNQQTMSNNLWNSPNSIFSSGMENKSVAPTQNSNIWQMKSLHSPHQIRPSVPIIRHSQSNQVFASPQQFHTQQNMNSFQSLPKFTPNTLNEVNSFNGNISTNMDISTLVNHTSKLTINEMISQPDLVETLKKSEKDIQFLHNVHFPEKQHIQAMNQHQHTMKFNFSGGGYGHLLPPNMSFADIASQSKEYQYRWFMKLSEMYGLEEADKFTELLRQIPLMTNSSYPTVLVDSFYNGFSDSSKNYNQLPELQHHHHPKAEKMSDHLLKIHTNAPNDAVANQIFQSNELDSIFIKSLQNQKVLEGNMISDNEVKLIPEQNFNEQQRNFSDRNILNGIDLFHMTPKPLDIELESVQSPQRSVPLYLRKTQHRSFE